MLWPFRTLLPQGPRDGKGGDWALFMPSGSRDPKIAAIGTLRQEGCCGRFEPSFPRGPGMAKGVIGPFSCRPALGTPR